MSQAKLTDAQLLEAARIYYDCKGNTTKAAGIMGVPESTLRNRLRWAKRSGAMDAVEADLDGPGFKVEAPRQETLSVDDLIADRKRRFEKKKRHEDSRKLIPVNVTLDGPVGILHFGDPHVDDDGTDIARLERDTEIVRTTEGMFGANVGDTTNNWVGRLARLYGDQTTSAAEAWQLAEWFIERVEWLYIIGGNHDGWSGAGDPIKWIAQQNGSLYLPSEIRLGLKFPNKQQVVINARHDFVGHSMYNPVHGAMKATLFGLRDDISICGHKHTSGYGLLKDPATGKICHSIQVASYKVFDRYAREKGLRDQHLSPSVTTIIDPYSKDGRNLIQVFLDPEAGAEYLTFLRKKWKKKKS